MLVSFNLKRAGNDTDWQDVLEVTQLMEAISNLLLLAELKANLISHQEMKKWNEAAKLTICYTTEYILKIEIANVLIKMI